MKICYEIVRSKLVVSVPILGRVELERLHHLIVVVGAIECLDDEQALTLRVNELFVSFPATLNRFEVD